MYTVAIDIYYTR